ncbi:hypothetical protein HY993_00655 [Candidatus Micrarchaeota archaeon]|nr:hypothetical protein [Candidatus Micrarchaeota archaeon]
MVVELSFEGLRRIALGEKQSSFLTKLDEGFYSNYREFLCSQEKSLEKSFSLDSVTVLENSRRVLKDIIKRREQKIFLKALNDYYANSVDSLGLAAQEKDLYSSIISLLVQHDGKTSFSSNSAPSQKKQEDGAVKLKILVNLPQFVGATQTIGPFRESQLVELPSLDAQLLLKREVAQKQ